ncbi:small, acid-soluble spore protein, alpha/beta type [Dehalobacter restrictus]|nr:small, acid-soluble spore protein, alpha/beta type [Dehalobacter restrictus]
MKMEIASELGIIQQVQNEGWDSLSPRISGKIGGKLSQRLKRINK